MDTIERRIEILERRLFGTDNSFEPRRSTIVADLDRIRRMLADKASIVSRLPIDQLQQMQSIRTTSNQVNADCWCSVEQTMFFSRPLLTNSRYCLYRPSSNCWRRMRRP
jgi:hypothetical protein